MDLKRIVEGLLFVTRSPLTPERLKALLPEVEADDIKGAVSALEQEYRDRNGGFYLARVAGGYQFRSQPDCKDWVSRLAQPSPHRISKAALETLSIIAYKQPLIRSEIEHIRGVDSGGVIRSLLDLKLIRVLGRKDLPGRPLIYATSRHFLELLGLNDIKDLPTLRDIEDLGRDRNSASEAGE
jgi:segregation and condensation protein B